MLTGWWDFAVRAFALLTSPRADIDRCDRDVEALARDSVVGTAVHESSLAVRRAWSTSRARAAAVAVMMSLVPVGGAGGWRVAGWMTAVAGATALLLRPLDTLRPGPLTWIVPAVLVVAGAAMMAAAGPLSRAAADRRRPFSSST